MPALDAVIETEALGKAFGRTFVLHDVSLRVAHGETVALFGPNGAGKSTLLRVCATLYRPTRGSIRLFGSAGADPSVRRRLGLLAHQSLLYPDLSARENLVFYARLYGLPHPEARADAWLARVALADAGDRPVRIFSRGMEQRVALARALLHDPDLILLDEPWSGLDAAAADLLTELLAGLQREERTLVVATHDFDRGLALADRVAILHRGRVAWESSDETAPAMVSAVYRRVTGAVAA